MIYPEQYTSLHQHLLAVHDDTDDVDAEQLIEITASCPTVSSYTIGGIDIAVDITIDGTGYTGEVTLVRDCNGAWNMWGDRDMWMSQPLLDAVEASDDEMTLMYGIVCECCAAIAANREVAVAADEEREDGRE